MMPHYALRHPGTHLRGLTKQECSIVKATAWRLSRQCKNLRQDLESEGVTYGVSKARDTWQAGKGRTYRDWLILWCRNVMSRLRDDLLSPVSAPDRGSRGYEPERAGQVPVRCAMTPAPDHGLLARERSQAVREAVRTCKDPDMVVRVFGLDGREPVSLSHVRRTEGTAIVYQWSVYLKPHLKAQLSLWRTG